MIKRIFYILAIMTALAAIVFGFAACASSSAPQTQAERGDALGTRVNVTVNAFTVSPATTQPTHDLGGYHVSRAEVNTLTSVNVMAAGTSSSGTTATAGNPTNTNTPNTSPNIPINLTPGAGLSIPGQN
jgi:hypothetical protein